MYLPAWKREGKTDPKARNSRIFEKGKARDYEDLRQNYVRRNNLTRAPYDHLGSFSKALAANTPRGLPVDERLWYFFEIFPEAFRVYRRLGQVLGIWGQYAAA